MPKKSNTLDQITRAAALRAQVEERLAAHPAPELETLIKLIRVIVLKLSVKADPAPEQLKVVSELMKPVLDWARLEEKRKEREFAEQKYARANAKNDASAEKALSPETLQKIERELKLF